MKLKALPADGYDGAIPPFPMPRPSKRESEVWEWAWATPQAAAWALEPWRWRTVAMWVRWSVRAEKRDESAAVISQVTRLADQIGLTPAGLKENGWRVAEDETAAPRREKAAETSVERPRSRFRVVNGDDAVDA